MNRAEKRRQKKLSGKRAKSAKSIHSALPPSKLLPPELQQVLKHAAQHFINDNLTEAENLFQKILAVDPNQPDALHYLGVIAHRRGAPEMAIEMIRRSITVQPKNAAAFNDLGLVLMALEKWDMAAESFGEAIRLDSNQSDSHYNLGVALSGLGNAKEGFDSYRRALSLNPKNNNCWARMAQSLANFTFNTIDDGLLSDLGKLLSRPGINHAPIIKPVLSAVQCLPGFAQIVDQTTSDTPEQGLSYLDMAERLSSIPLFLQIMAQFPIADLRIERMLSYLRSSLLKEVSNGNPVKPGQPFATALALHCFTNEYVYTESAEDSVAVEDLEQRIANRAQQFQTIPPQDIAALGAYRPLYKVSYAQNLLESNWDENIKPLIERQITEPNEELAIRSTIPRLTTIDDSVSRSVRAQYEENPYPRWIAAAQAPSAMAIDSMLQKKPLQFDIGNYKSPENPEILIAGCGTGRHSILTASRFLNARVLAVDLSLNSLSYAKRKTNELGIRNIEYAQADIMELGSLGRQFDLIESSGVLHHLGDPFAGWKVLVSLLCPNGFMKISLYSEFARRAIVKGRSLIQEMAYTSAPKDIRRCRQDIASRVEHGQSELAPILRPKDFYSLSECRDFLFHEQEHRFTLLQIEKNLADLDLKFLGFELENSRTLASFHKAHSGQKSRTPLSLWHEFELKNPDTFAGMYHFWCQKA